MRSLTRIAMGGGAAAVLAAGSVFLALPAHAQSGGACTLAGTASFDGNGLPPAPGGAFTYNFSGTLSSCESNVGAPASGTVAAGTAYQVTVTGSGYTATYALPEPTGSGSCAQSTTSGTAVTTWKDGSTTIEKYTTTGAAAAVELQGTVESSATLDLVSSSGTAPATYTLTGTNTSFKPGDGVVGQLAFSTMAPQGCASGLKSASINGVIGVGAA